MTREEDVLDRARGWLDDGKKVALATVTATWGSSPRPRGSQLVVREDGLFAGSVSGGCVEGKVVEAAQEIMQSGAARDLEFGVSNDDAWEVGLACGGTVKIHVEPLTSSSEIFSRPKTPPLRLVIVGAVHIAESLASLAEALGYDVTIVDPRLAFARKERWPHATVRAEWPEEAFPALAVDRRTAIVTLTHDPKIDEPALLFALSSDAFYIGALGSKKTHAARLARLRERGASEASLAKIHGPVGLAIGAKTPAEIAISILAQMTQVLRAEPEGDAAAR